MLYTGNAEEQSSQYNTADVRLIKDIHKQTLGTNLSNKQ